MTTITIKNIPQGLYKRLKESAERHRRSINSEVITCLERALRSQPFDADEFLARARSLRGELKGVFVRDRDLKTPKGEGRS